MDETNPDMAPKVLATGMHMPRVKRPKRGPPTIPKTAKAA